MKQRLSHGDASTTADLKQKEQGSHAVGQEWTPLSLAQHFHNLYERAAPEFGYETRTETRAFNPESSNGKLMIAVCSEILRDFNAALAAEREQSVNVLRERVLEFAEQSGSQIKRIRDLEHQLDEEREKAKVGKDL